MQKEVILEHCKKLLLAYQNGKLGYMRMPEEQHPQFSDQQQEERYFFN